MSSFFQCSDAAFDLDLSNTAFKVYLFLSRSANNVTRESFYSRSNIAKQCKMSVSTVIRSCKELCKIGLLEIRPRFSEKGRQTSNLYILLDNQQMHFSQSEPREGDALREVYNHGYDKESSQAGVQAKARLFPCVSSIFQKDFTPNQLKVYSYLSARAGRDRRCYPSYKEIAKDCRISVSTVYRCVKKLCEYDFLETIPQNRMETCGNRGRSVNLYLLKKLDAEHNGQSKTKIRVIETKPVVPENQNGSKPINVTLGKGIINRISAPLFPTFISFLTPSPMSQVTPQRTKPRNNLKQRKKIVFSQVTEWYRPFEDQDFTFFKGVIFRSEPP